MPVHHSIEQRAYDNGAQALLVDVPDSPVTSYGVHFRVQENMEYPQQTLHTLEHITSSYTVDPSFTDKKAYRRELEKNGAYVNASTYPDGINYYGYGTGNDYGRVIALRRALIERPKITDEIVNAEKGNVTQELRRNVPNFNRLVYNLARKAIDPLHMTDSERLQTVGPITKSDVEDVFRLTHVASSQRFVIIGDIGTGDDIDAMIGNWSLPKGEVVARSAFVGQPGTHISYEHHENLESQYVTIALALPDVLTAEEYETMKVVNYMLFNSQGSRVLGEARSRGIAYHTHGFIDDSRANANWMIEFPVSEDTMKPLISLIGDHLKTIMDGDFDAAEVAGAVQYMKGKFIMSGLTTDELYDIYANSFFNRDTVTPMSVRKAIYEDISKQSIITLVRKFVSGTIGVGGTGNASEEAFKEAFLPLVNLQRAS